MKALAFAFTRVGEAVAKLADFSRNYLQYLFILFEIYKHVQMESAKKKSGHVDG